MDDLIQPALIMVVGLVVAVVVYVLIDHYNKSPKQQSTMETMGAATPDESEHAQTYIEKLEPRNRIDVSFSVWQGFKFGFGLGLGLILATGVFWIVLSSFVIATLTSFVKTVTF